MPKRQPQQLALVVVSQEGESVELGVGDQVGELRVDILPSLPPTSRRAEDSRARSLLFLAPPSPVELSRNIC